MGQPMSGSLFLISKHTSFPLITEVFLLWENHCMSFWKGSLHIPTAVSMGPRAGQYECRPSCFPGHSACLRKWMWLKQRTSGSSLVIFCQNPRRTYSFTAGIHMVIGYEFWLVWYFDIRKVNFKEVKSLDLDSVRLGARYSFGLFCMWELLKGWERELLAWFILNHLEFCQLEPKALWLIWWGGQVR